MRHPNFIPFPNLITERLTLRKLELGDSAEIFVLRSDITINRYIKRELAKNRKEAEEWIHKVLNLEQKGESINWAICLNGESKLIGSICLWNIQSELERAEVGYSLHCDYFGRGFMHESLTEVIRYGFEKMKLKRIDAYTNKNNKASLKLLQKNNFERNLVFERDFEDKEELEYNVIYTLLNPKEF